MLPFLLVPLASHWLILDLESQPLLLTASSPLVLLQLTIQSCEPQGAQTKTGALTDADGFIGPLTGAVSSGQYILTNNVDGSGIQIGSVVSSSSKYTISTTANAISTQFVGAANQYVDIVSNTDTYARFNNATQSLMIGGDIPATPGIQLAGTTVTATTFAGNASTATKLATARDITVILTGNVTGF